MAKKKKSLFFKIMLFVLLGVIFFGIFGFAVKLRPKAMKDFEVEIEQEEQDPDPQQGQGEQDPDPQQGQGEIEIDFPFRLGTYSDSDGSYDGSGLYSDWYICTIDMIPIFVEDDDGEEVLNEMEIFSCEPMFESLVIYRVYCYGRLSEYLGSFEASSPSEGVYGTEVLTEYSDAYYITISAYLGENVTQIVANYLIAHMCWNF